MDTFITNSKETIKTLITQIKPSLPVIYFFLLLFYSIIILFGTKYVMIAMVITLQFKLNYQKNHTIKGLAIFVITQLCLQFLAFFATLNLPLCIILNIIVPFIFIFAKSSQFYPLGYFSYLMTFTFLQLTPVNFSGLPYQLAVMIYSLLLFTVAIVLYNHNHAKVEIGFKSEQQGMNLLASLIKQQIHTPNKILDLKPLQLIQQSLYKKAYETRGRKHILSEEGRKHYLFALMFQRAIYCITYLNNLDTN